MNSYVVATLTFVAEFIHYLNSLFSNRSGSPLHHFVRVLHYFVILSHRIYQELRFIVVRQRVSFTIIWTATRPTPMPSLRFIAFMTRKTSVSAYNFKWIFIFNQYVHLCCVPDHWENKIYLDVLYHDRILYIFSRTCNICMERLAQNQA